MSRGLNDGGGIIGIYVRLRASRADEIARGSRNVEDRKFNNLYNNIHDHLRTVVDVRLNRRIAT